MADTSFVPGLEGVVAFETEIAEPDKEGGVLRYRGVDIAELVGHVPYERVWGLLVDNDLNSVMPDPEPYQPPALTGNAPADLQSETARLAGLWKLGKTNEISDELRDVHAAIPQNPAFLVRLGDLVLDGDDALEPGLEVIGHGWNLPGPARPTPGHVVRSPH